MIGKPSIKSALKLTAATIYGQEFQLRSLDTGEIRNKFEYLIIKPLGLPVIFILRHQSKRGNLLCNSKLSMTDKGVTTKERLPSTRNTQ